VFINLEGPEVNRLRRIGLSISTILYVAILGLVLVPAQTALAAADSCFWTGAVNANWSNGANWNGCDNGGVPESGDTLVFNSGATGTRTMNNDMPGLTPAAITISDTGYTFNGNALTFVTSGNAFTTTADATVNLQVAFNGFNTGGSVASGKTLTFAQPVAFGSGGGQYWTGSGTVVFAGALTGSTGGMFRAENNSTVRVNGASNTFTSSFVGAESNATFECNSLTCFGAAANAIYSGGGKVDLKFSGTYTNPVVTSLTTADDSWLRAYTNVSLSGAVTINDALNVGQYSASSLQFNGSSINNTSELNLFGTNSVNSIIRLNTGMSGVGTLAINTVFVQLNTASSYSGTTTVNSGGIASVENATGLGTAAAGTIVNGGGSLQFKVSSATTVNEPLVVAGEGLATSPAAIYSDSTNDVTLSGTINLTGDTTIQTKNIGRDIVITSIISGTGNLSLLGAYDSGSSGSISLDGVAPNTYDGTTYMLGGVVYAEKAGAIPGDITFDTIDPSVNPSTLYLYNSTNVVSDTSVVTLNASEDTFKIGNSGTETIGGLAGTAGQVSFQNSGSGLIVDQDFNSTYGGDFYADGNLETVTKRGTGTLFLTGTNPYNFDEINFVVEQGTLSVNGNVKTNTGTVTVQSGGVLKGSGTVGSLITNGGKVAPGNSPGTLHAASLSLNASTTFEEEIAGATAGSQYDQVVSTGAVNLGNAVLSIVPSYTPASGQVFTIITGTSITGAFNGLVDGATTTINGLKFRINYTATTVTLTYVDGQLVAGVPNTGVQAKTMTAPVLATIAGIALIATWFGVTRFESKIRSTPKV
jgi:fibronectin-binding autotransporter adhesin